jgi:hypothetical protein
MASSEGEAAAYNNCEEAEMAVSNANSRANDVESKLNDAENELE